MLNSFTKLILRFFLYIKILQICWYFWNSMASAILFLLPYLMLQYVFINLTLSALPLMHLCYFLPIFLIFSSFLTYRVTISYLSLCSSFWSVEMYWFCFGVPDIVPKTSHMVRSNPHFYCHFETGFF